jgi:hypothetical protein
MRGDHRGRSRDLGTVTESVWDAPRPHTQTVPHPGRQIAQGSRRPWLRGYYPEVLHGPDAISVGVTPAVLRQSSFAFKLRAIAADADAGKLGPTQALQACFKLLPPAANGRLPAFYKRPNAFRQ